MHFLFYMPRCMNKLNKSLHIQNQIIKEGRTDHTEWRDTYTYIYMPKFTTSSIHITYTYLDYMNTTMDTSMATLFATSYRCGLRVGSHQTNLMCGAFLVSEFYIL